MSLPQPLVELCKLISKMPGISSRGAERFLDFWWRGEKSDSIKMEKAWQGFNQLIPCRQCFYFSEDGICGFCSDKERDQKKICVVASPFLVPLIEKEARYNGLYFVLDGEIVSRNGGRQLLTVKKRRDYLKNRIINEKISEVIIATDFTSPGEATAMFIKEELKDLPVRISKLARGLQSGDIISYSDPITLRSAFENRTEM